MPYPSVTPFDVLGVSSSASLKEIMQAYQKALRQRRYPPTQVAQAFNELRNARKRSEHTLLIITDQADGRAVSDILAGLGAPAFVSDEPAPVPISLPPVSESDFADDFRPLPDPAQSFLPWPGEPDVGAVLPNLPSPS